MAIDGDRVVAHRQAVQEALQEHLPNQAPEGALVTRWVVIYELMDPEGERWLTRSHNETSTAWDAKGMLYEGLTEIDWEQAE